MWFNKLSCNIGTTPGTWLVAAQAIYNFAPSKCSLRLQVHFWVDNFFLNWQNVTCTHVLFCNVIGTARVKRWKLTAFPLVVTKLSPPSPFPIIFCRVQYVSQSWNWVVTYKDSQYNMPSEVYQCLSTTQYTHIMLWLLLTLRWFALHNFVVLYCILCQFAFK